MASHSHAGHMPSSGKALVISAWLTGVYFVIELAVGLWTGSIAVLSDAFHTLSAVGGVLVAITAQRIARRPADSTRSFGWYRAEIIGALVNGGFLLGMALLVIWMGAMRLGDPIHLATGPMLWVAFGGLVTEVVSLALMSQLLCRFIKKFLQDSSRMKRNPTWYFTFRFQFLARVSTSENMGQKMGFRNRGAAGS